MRLHICVVALCLGVAVPALGQDEPGPLAQGWALLAKGDAAAAAQLAEQQLQRRPNNTAALSLAVDAELVRGGAAAGLAMYEKWQGTRRLDDAYVLRRVAYASLREASRMQSAARIEALQQLAADGDAAAAAALEQALQAKSFGETRALASIGNERAVDALIADLNAGPDSKGPIIEALAQSGSKRAIKPLMSVLSDPNEVTRAGAADALGRLGAAEAIPRLKTLLNDSALRVRLKAAGALYRLNDSSGLSVLTELARSEHATIQVAAARELSVQPDASWQALVRNLTNDTDPTVRLEAARLIAPYDLSLANSVLDALMQSDNISVREDAAGVLVDRVATDFATLRGLLRSGDATVRVKAAGRILELTR